MDIEKPTDQFPHKAPSQIIQNLAPRWTKSNFGILNTLNLYEG